MAERFSTGFINEVCGAGGSSMADALNDCVMYIYSGSQPATADAAETGTLLAIITQDSGAFVSGAADNGLSFGAATAGVASKSSGEVWSGVGLADGTAGWFRIYGNTVVTGDDSGTLTAIRVDGSISTASGADLQMSNTSITTGGTTTISTASLTFPAS